MQQPIFYIGTTNPHKIREIASILRPFGLQLIVTDPIDPEETGGTFEENAEIKARAYALHIQGQLVGGTLSQYGTAKEINNYLRLSRTWTICEDSGIVIPSLDGLPGPYSARFSDCILEGNKIIGHSPSKRDREEIDRENNLRVLSLMENIPWGYRTASFVVSVMIADVCGHILFHTTNSVDGYIVNAMCGEHGFGYDPIFVSEKSFGKTYAQIDSMRKNLISHRRKALQALTMWLGEHIS